MQKINPHLLDYKMATVGVVILTLNAEKHLANCLKPLMQSSLNPKILIVDSASTDNTIFIAKQYGIEVMGIDRKTFNHGGTREMARNHLKTDIVVMVTPDAYAADGNVLGVLINPIVEGKAAVAYARQLPHEGAGFFEAFPRCFNYPPQSQFRSICDRDKFGAYTFFCSNSFAAYSNKALDAIGGFKNVLLGEDTVAVAELLRKGYQVAYVAEAEVRHSHKYSLMQEFRRYFDTGLARRSYGVLLESGASDGTRGREFAWEMGKELLRTKPYLLPYGIVQTGVKWFGYRLGMWSGKMPVWFKRALSGHPGYWT